MELMKEDLEDMHRAEYWDLMKGITEPDKANMLEDNDSGVLKTSAIGERRTASARTPPSSTQATPSTGTSTQSSCAGMVDGTCSLSHVDRRRPMDVDDKKEKVSNDPVTKTGQKHLDTITTNTPRISTEEEIQICTRQLHRWNSCECW